MSDGVAKLQRFLYLTLSHGLARQNGLDKGLDEDGLAGTVFQEEDAVVAIEAEGRVDIAFFATVVDDVSEANPTD